MLAALQRRPYFHRQSFEGMPFGRIFAPAEYDSTTCILIWHSISPQAIQQLGTTWGCEPLLKDYLEQIPYALTEQCSH